MVPNTEVRANTDEPATEIVNGPGCATMNRRKVATPRRIMLRSMVSGTSAERIDPAGRRTDGPGSRRDDPIAIDQLVGTNSLGSNSLGRNSICRRLTPRRMYVGT